MKKLLTIISSFIIAVAFSNAAMAAQKETKVYQIPPSKQNKLKPNEPRVQYSKSTTKSTQQTGEDKNKTSQNYGQKVEKKDDPPKK